MRISDWSSDVCSSDLPSASIIENLTQRREGAKEEEGAHTKTQRCRCKPRHRALTRPWPSDLPDFARPSNANLAQQARRRRRKTPSSWLWGRIFFSSSFSPARLCVRSISFHCSLFISFSLRRHDER